MTMTTQFYRTQFASALKYYYPNEVMQELCYRNHNILKYLNKVKALGGGRQDMWSINTYPSDGSRACAETDALKTPVAPQYTDAYVTPKTRYTRRFVSSAVLDDSRTRETAIIQAINKFPTEIAEEHSFANARNLWYTGSASYYGGIGMCSTTSASYVVSVETNFNFNRIFRGMKIDVKDQYGDDATNAGSLTISDYSEANCTITVATTAITTTSANVIGIEDEITGSSSTYGSNAWNSLPLLVGEGNVCNVTVSSYPEYKAKVYSSVGTLGLGDIQAAVDWVEAHSKGKFTVLHASPQVIVKYADIFLGDVRLSQDDLARVTIGYPGQLLYRGGSMGLLPIEKDHLMPKDEIYCINWDSIRFLNSAYMKWFDEDGSIFHREAGYLNYELLFYSRGDLAVYNRNANAALTGISI